MSITLPENDCQAFTIFNLSSQNYVGFGRYHDIGTYTTTADAKSAVKFVRYRVGSSPEKGYTGIYVIMDEHGNVLTFNKGGRYSFALHEPWGGDVYQTFEMGKVEDSPEAQSYIKVAGKELYAQRFIHSDLENQIFIGDNPGAQAQGSFIFKPVSDSEFSIPEISKGTLASPQPPEESTDIAWSTRSLVPRFLVPAAHLLDSDPLANPYYFLDEGQAWQLIRSESNRTTNPSTLSFDETYGLSEEVSETVSKETNIEMSASAGGVLRAFDFSLSASISQTWGWSRSVTSAWTKQRTMTVSSTVDANQRLYAYQKKSILHWMPMSMDTVVALPEVGLESYDRVSVPVQDSAG
jgi:hypothetical protein